jgi:hypothetical protein
MSAPEQIIQDLIRANWLNSSMGDVSAADVTFYDTRGKLREWFANPTSKYVIATFHELTESNVLSPVNAKDVDTVLVDMYMRLDGDYDQMIELRTLWSDYVWTLMHNSQNLNANLVIKRMKRRCMEVDVYIREVITVTGKSYITRGDTPQMVLSNEEYMHQHHWETEEEIVLTDGTVTNLGQAVASGSIRRIRTISARNNNDADILLQIKVGEANKLSFFVLTGTIFVWASEDGIAFASGTQPTIVMSDFSADAGSLYITASGIEA